MTIEFPMNGSLWVREAYSRIENYLENTSSIVSLSLLSGAYKLLENAMSHNSSTADRDVFRSEVEDMRELLSEALLDTKSIVEDHEFIAFIPDIIKTVLMTAPASRHRYAHLVADRAFDDLTEAYMEADIRETVPYMDVVIDQLRDVLNTHPLLEQPPEAEIVAAAEDMEEVEPEIQPRWSLAQQNSVPERVLVLMSEYDAALRKQNTLEDVSPIVENYMAAKVAMYLRGGDVVVRARDLLQDFKRQYADMDMQDRARFLADAMPAVMTQIISRVPDQSFITIRDAAYDFVYYTGVEGNELRSWLANYISDAARERNITEQIEATKEAENVTKETKALPDEPPSVRNLAKIVSLDSVISIRRQKFKDAAQPAGGDVVPARVLEGNRVAREINAMQLQGDFGRNAVAKFREMQERLFDPQNGNINEAFLGTIQPNISEMLHALKESSYFTNGFNRANHMLRRLEVMSQMPEYIALCPTLPQIVNSLQHELLIAADGDLKATMTMRHRFMENISVTHLAVDPENLQVMFNILRPHGREWVSAFVDFANMFENSKEYQAHENMASIREALLVIARDTPRDIEDVQARKDMLQQAEYNFEQGEYLRAYHYGKLGVALSFVNDERQNFHWKDSTSNRHAMFCGAVHFGDGLEDIMLIREGKHRLSYVMNGEVMTEADAFEFAEDHVNERGQNMLARALPNLTRDFLDRLKQEDTQVRPSALSMLFR